MKNKAKQLAKEFCKKFNIIQPCSESLKKALELQGYFVVHYNHLSNIEAVDNILNSLKLKKYSQCVKAFTYVDNNNRMVFIIDGLSDDEESILLAHEEGHILFGHMLKNGIYGTDITNEWEANEFAHYILENKKNFLNSDFHNTKKNKKIYVILLTILILSMISIIVLNNSNADKKNKQSEIQNEIFYITKSGEKYHLSSCSYVKNKSDVRALTKDKLQKTGYEPCSTCIK